MVVIRLARIGKIHQPIYRVTVADQRRYATGKFIEVIGHYEPNIRGRKGKATINLAKYKEWVSKGAQPTDRVKSVVKFAETSPVQ